MFADLTEPLDFAVDTVNVTPLIVTVANAVLLELAVNPVIFVVFAPNL